MLHAAFACACQITTALNANEEKIIHYGIKAQLDSIGTSLQVLPSLWSADFFQNWQQEIPQIIAQNS